jgi:hypothetical protein
VPDPSGTSSVSGIIVHGEDRGIAPCYLSRLCKQPSHSGPIEVSLLLMDMGKAGKTIVGGFNPERRSAAEIIRLLDLRPPPRAVFSAKPFAIRRETCALAGSRALYRLHLEARGDDKDAVRTR